MTHRMMRIALTCAGLFALGVGLRAEEAQAPAKKPVPHAASKAKGHVVTRKRRIAIPESKRLDLNTATKAQLEKLPGVTPAYADQIIAHRPYLTNEHLVINKVVPENVYFSIRELVTARPPAAKPAAGHKAVSKKH